MADELKGRDNESQPSPTDASRAESDRQSDDFAQQAEEAPPGLLMEFVDFLRYNKKWWLTPIIIVLLLLALFIFLSGSVAAPFIYPLF